MMINSGSLKRNKPMMEGFGEIITLEETAKYLKILFIKWQGKGKFPL